MWSAFIGKSETWRNLESRRTKHECSHFKYYININYYTCILSSVLRARSFTKFFWYISKTNPRLCAIMSYSLCILGWVYWSVSSEVQKVCNYPNTYGLDRLPACTAAAVCKTYTSHCEETHYSLLPLQTSVLDAVARNHTLTADDTAQILSHFKETRHECIICS